MAAELSNLLSIAGLAAGAHLEVVSDTMAMLGRCDAGAAVDQACLGSLVPRAT